MTPEQIYRLELAKEKTPSTGSFILWLPLFVFIAWMCKEPVQQVAEANDFKTVAYHPSAMPETSLKLLGWEIF